MKIIITESQYKRILKEEEEQKVLRIPSFKFFNHDWNMLQRFLEEKGNPPYSIGGNLYLYETPISEKYSEEEIRQMVNVDEIIYLK